MKTNGHQWKLLFWFIETLNIIYYTYWRSNKLKSDVEYDDVLVYNYKYVGLLAYYIIYNIDKIYINIIMVIFGALHYFIACHIVLKYYYYYFFIIHSQIF